MYYTPTKRRPLKRRRARPAAAVTYYTPPQQRGRTRSARITPYPASRRRRVTVRTRTGQVLLFLIILGVIGWYSGLIPMEMAKLSAAMTPSVGPIPQTALVYPGQHSIQGAPTISAAKIDSILCSTGSPACGSGQEIYHLGVIYNINPAYALAFFQHESSFGLAGAARYTHSLGNLRCIPNYPCPDGYASFPTWSEGFQAWYVLIDSNIYVRSGHTSIETIIPVYAPSGDNNDVNAYINSVIGAVESWEK